MGETGSQAGGDQRRWRLEAVIVGLSLLAIVLHLLLRFLPLGQFPVIHWPLHQWPLLMALVLGGAPLLLVLIQRLLQRDFGADILAGLSILTAVLLDEYLAGTLVVLMLSGGHTLETYAMRNASAVLRALAQRVPASAHRKQQGGLHDVTLEQLAIGDELVVFPHEICPVDGTVLIGHGSMDESYLTGEPYVISKAPGSTVLSGAINGQEALTIRADRLPVDSRYAKIMQVMRQSEQQRPRLRRLGDRIGAVYAPLAIAVALIAWWVSGDAVRFLAVLVVATPCPLLIAIPVAIIGSVSLAARRGIIIKDPTVLERIDRCETALFDKTGTLTYGRPALTEVIPAPELSRTTLLALVASLERYSRHPLAGAVLDAAKREGVALDEPQAVSEKPGSGLRGEVNGYQVLVSSRQKLSARYPDLAAQLPPSTGGMECVVLCNGLYAGVCRFRDEPREEGRAFIRHLRGPHAFKRLLLVSGDREEEVRYLAERVGIAEVYASQSPEQKLALVKAETARANTVFMGDGINDAPALTAATVGIAFGQGSDITAEAAGAVILDSSLQRVDELLHIGRRMRHIALQSAVGGMALSLVAMLIAADGHLAPVAGAIVQELIDVLAVANALRAAMAPRQLSDL